ncbi:DUF5675 family protein [Helicobacter acinonychis]|uniref:DUF5675 domain-containing protein n=1 Tax=Helicobacter acinonychis (strain Sheeba) TaxID=382638 RepID=Q17VI8_HELAH|nr:DUF5675 family protein [Helicobacter acinonychis]CAK00338.1 hypothetical protein Hac_1630 [Helicobacter acinonychis str. Sheeba]
MYLVLLERKEDLKPLVKKGKEESGMLGNLRVFLCTHDQDMSDEALVEHYKDKDALLSCFSLENSGEGTDTPNLDKPIIAREYQLAWSDTSCTVPKEYQNKKCNNQRHEALQLVDKNHKDFAKRKILIHVGNSAHDTLGCILLGMQHDEDMIYKSSEAVKRFFDLVKEKGADQFVFKIIDKV